MNVRVEPEVWIAAFSVSGPSADLVRHLLGSRHRLFTSYLRLEEIKQAVGDPAAASFVRRHAWPAEMLEPSVIVAMRRRRGRPPTIAPADFYAFELKC